MINPYKRLDVFKCSQETHRRFEGRVSVQHVIKEKKCYPQGCLYFLWRCALREKGRRCIHGFEYTGKTCKGCTYYVEEKIHLQPQLLLNKSEYDVFLEELDSFDAWLDSVCFRRLFVAGRIKTVKPWFELFILHRKHRVSLRGYLLVFKKGFIGMHSFDDTFYVRVSESLMRNFHFIPKMKVEMKGEIRRDRGRVVVHRPGNVEIVQRGWGKPWTREKALVAVKTASLLEEQPDLCLACPWGALADVTDEGDEERHYRNLYCLKGVAEPDGCYVRAEKLLKKK
jgi:hypothetical protein